MNSSGATCYRSFILRIWHDETDAQKQPCWRYVLLDPEREYRRGFTSLDQLFVTLAMEISRVERIKIGEAPQNESEFLG